MKVRRYGERRLQRQGLWWGGEDHYPIFFRGNQNSKQVAQHLASIFIFMLTPLQLHLQSWAIRLALGCVNSAPGPDGARKRDERNLGPTD